MDYNSLSFEATTTTASSFVDKCCDARTCLGGVVWTVAFNVRAGETKEVFYEYEASKGSDWYEAAIVLYKTTEEKPRRVDLDPQVSEVLQVNVRRGNRAPMGEEVFAETVGEGRYFIGFFLGSYDATNGGRLGSQIVVRGLGRRDPR